MKNTDAKKRAKRGKCLLEIIFIPLMPRPPKIGQPTMEVAKNLVVMWISHATYADAMATRPEIAGTEIKATQILSVPYVNGMATRQKIAGSKTKNNANIVNDLITQKASAEGSHLT